MRDISKFNTGGGELQKKKKKNWKERSKEKCQTMGAVVNVDGGDSDLSRRDHPSRFGPLERGECGCSSSWLHANDSGWPVRHGVPS